MAPRAFTHATEKRACPHGARVTPALETRRQTSQLLSTPVDAEWLATAVVAFAATIVCSLSASTLAAWSCSNSVCAATLWLTAGSAQGPWCTGSSFRASRLGPAISCPAFSCPDFSCQIPPPTRVYSVHVSTLITTIQHVCYQSSEVESRYLREKNYLVTAENSVKCTL